MKKPVFALMAIIAGILSCFMAVAQDIKWNDTPEKGFVYEISNKEAQQLLTGKVSDEKFIKLLHTLVDTFDVKTGWNNRPSAGHFILTTIVGTKLHCNYTCVFPYQVFLLREYNALSLQVVDHSGIVRDDAKVKLGFRRIGIDKESKNYRIEDEGFTGNRRFVTVECDGFRSVFDIERHEVPTWYNHGDEYEGPAFYSYLITDKNKYKPGERVRFKSYALSHVKYPLRKELEIWLTSYPFNKKIGVISPHRPGSYAGEFQLHDSLKLTLDKNFMIQLREKNGRTVSSCSFKYEDYELSGNKLDLQLKLPRHFFPEDNRLIITATDVNGLLLKDARAEILVTPVTVLKTLQPLCILPDTLFYTTLNLDPGVATILDIPCDLFQQTNLAYEVQVTVLNSQNQRLEGSKPASYYFSNYELSAEFSNDSLCFSLLKNNVAMHNVAALLKTDNDTSARSVILPYKEKINPAICTYQIKNDRISQAVQLSALNPKLELIGGIQRDSFRVYLNNPQKLEVSWYIYQGSHLLSKGFGHEMAFESLIDDRTHTYYVELLYSFGGQEYARRKQYEFKEDYLDVMLDIPDRVYPGQQVNATISVSDQSGNPLKNVDLTAMAVTGKLDYFIPDLPYYGSSSVPRPKSATYSKKDLENHTRILELDYTDWEGRSRLDTMLYFRFRYPKPEGFVYVLPISDSTQFAPFVMEKGKSKLIHVIEVDRRPVYYSWTTQPKGYSFYIVPGRKHEITLRLSDRVLVLDSMSFEKSTKTIISVDFDHLPANTKTVKMENKFTPTEISRHTSYTAQFKVVPNNFAYLQSVHEFYPLFNKYNLLKKSPNVGSVIAGPILPGRTTYSESDQLKTTYKHSGGFSYAFEDNIVYKLTPKWLLPKILYDGYIDPMETISDRAYSKEYFLKMQKIQAGNSPTWKASTLDISDNHTRLRVFLPDTLPTDGIAALLFQDCKSRKIVPPTFNSFYHNASGTYSLPVGYHAVIVLLENGSYLKMDSVMFRKHASIAVALSESNLAPADDESLSWLITYMWMHIDYGRSMTSYPSRRTSTFHRNYSPGNVTGTIYDENNEPLPGAVVLVKGTDYGTVTDIDGCFSLQIDDYQATITIGFIGFVSKEMNVTRGSVVVVQLEPDVTALEEVVVVGYGTVSKQSVTGSVVTLQGRAAGLASVPDELEESVVDDVLEDSVIYQAGERLYQELLSLKTIRKNFSDVGFWEPFLFTDKNGKANFDITFPEDITRWDAVVYAMNKYAQTGTARRAIRSYKPIMAELSVPLFLTRGDTSLLLGKVSNFSSDSTIKGTVEWGGSLSEGTKPVSFSHFHADLIPLYVTGKDTITARYSFSRNDGYYDGEERTIPVVEQGIERAEGSLSIMDNGSSVEVGSKGDKEVTVTLLSNQLDLYAGEINALMYYRYDCNEQLASKLIGLLSYKLLMESEGKAFHYNGLVKNMIRRLLRNQNRTFLWSWWDVSENTSYWMSAHILKALKFAREAGFDVDLNVENIARKADYKFTILNNYTLSDIELLNALACWNVELDYSRHIEVLDSIIISTEEREMKNVAGFGYPSSFSYLKEKLLLMEIRQMKGIPYQREFLLEYKKEGVLGDVFFTDDKPVRYWYADNLSANIIAYRIVRNDSLLNNLLLPMQMHFVTTREHGEWNTYQSSGIIMNVLPDLLKAGYTKEQPASVQVKGKENKTITNFPYSVTLHDGEYLHILKESGLPLFLMQYTKEVVTKAHTGVEGFRINTFFGNNSHNLIAGKPVDLIVNVTVEKDSPVEHVLIEVPIPGGCSYVNKHQHYQGVETYREYFKERTIVCCEKLDPGRYSFVIQLLPRFTGKYYLNPAQVSLMYFPVVNANTDMERVCVE
ncbi:MAG: carboxypeptidase-like regulatory domain-containing protein [Bacteroidales bacterium]|nr:carboxypeptidase-like regulatory domain-containing protein [Bacteroidales bacterium]